MTQKFISIDEDGYPQFGELRVQDVSIGQEILENLFVHEANSLVTTLDGEKYIVEAFDEPFVAQMVHCDDNQFSLTLPYDLHASFELKSLSLDEWDRFHGYAKLSEKLIPFVMSRKAQAEFFRLLDEFDDDSICFRGERIPIPTYWTSQSSVHHAEYWSNIYQTESTPGWDLGQAHPALQDMLPRLKLAKSRVIVLGCGPGHDAAFFAQAGHLVTAVDISEEALQRAKANYGHLENIQWVQADVFALPKEMSHSYDIVFEHTCYCAVDPAKRSDLVQNWQKLMSPGGFLMGIFFAMEKRQGPPFGGSEWELRQRLQKHYQFLFWGRWHQSPPSRHGKEFFVYARKL